MNFTLVSFSLINSSLISPLLAPSLLSFSPIITQEFSKLHISNSFQSFFYMKPYLYSSMHRKRTSLSFTNSHFINFLQSTITISDNSFQSLNNSNLLSKSEENSKSRIFKREKIENTIYSNEDIVLKAINCFFIECTEPTSGGGINMICEESSLYVIKCCFVNCYAQSQGGAISFFGNLLKINDTCFDGCYTMDSAMAVEVYLKGSTEKVIMNSLSITNCADKNYFSPRREEDKSDNFRQRFDEDNFGQFGVYLSNVIDLCRGKQKLKTINSTNNIVHLTGGFCYSDESTSFSLSFSTIMENIADSIFTLYDFPASTCEISKCNIVNNTGSLSLSLFDLENSTLDVFECAFLLNNITFLASNGILHFENCEYDFNGKNIPLENAEFAETGNILNKIKKWRSVKTIAFDQSQISYNLKIYERCRKQKPSTNEYDREMHNNRIRDHGFDNFGQNRFNDKDNNNNDKEEDPENDIDKHKNNKNKNRNNEDDENDNDYKNKNKNKEDDENDNKIKDRNNKDIFDNDKNNQENDNIKQKADNDEIFNNLNNDNNKNNKNKNKNNDDEEEEEEEEDDKNKNNKKKENKNKKNEYDEFKNKINIADNEDQNEEDEEDDNMGKNANSLFNDKKGHSLGWLFTIIFILLIGGIFAYIYIFYVRNRERDINRLEDVEML